MHGVTRTTCTENGRTRVSSRTWSTTTSAAYRYPTRVQTGTVRSWAIRARSASLKGSVAANWTATSESLTRYNQPASFPACHRSATT